MPEPADNNGNSKWQWTFGLVAVGAVLTGAMISFFVQNNTAALQVAALAARVDAGEVVQRAIVDRNVLQREQLAVIDAKMIEIETQFCGSDTVRNLIHGENQRLFSMLWRQVFPTMTFPTDNSYYPQICNRSIGSGH